MQPRLDDLIVKHEHALALAAQHFKGADMGGLVMSKAELERLCHHESGRCTEVSETFVAAWGPADRPASVREDGLIPSLQLGGLRHLCRQEPHPGLRLGGVLPKAGGLVACLPHDLDRV